jgi:hypothetical protein
MHPRRGEKIQGGVAAIVVKINRVPGQPDQRGFCVVHDDGSRIDFGAYKCFEKSEPQENFKRYFNELSDAGRFAIRLVTAAIKQRAFDNPPVFCAVSGIELTWREAAVDHAPPWQFKKIVTAWYKLQPSPPVLIDRQVYREFAENDAKSFCEFHDARAILRIVHHKENSRLGSGA